jgi:hypothetical protein
MPELTPTVKKTAPVGVTGADKTSDELIVLALAIPHFLRRDRLL